MRLSIALGNQEQQFIGNLSGYLRASFSRALNTPGEGSIVLPDVYPPDFFQELQRVRVTWAKDGRTPALLGDTIWHVKGMIYDEDNQTVELLVVDNLGLLKNVIIAYPADSEYADKTEENGNNGPVDDLIKAYVRENGGSLTVDGFRGLGLIAVDPDRSMGHVTSKQASYQPLLDTIKSLADESKAKGLSLYYDLVQYERGFLRFVMRYGLWGTMQTDTGLRFSKRSGTLTNVVITYDYREKTNLVIVGGEGQGLERITATIRRPDYQRIGMYDFGERFVDASSAETAEAMESEAYTELERTRVKPKLTASLVEGPGAYFGFNYNLGDLVVAEARKQSFTAIIDAFSVSAEGENVSTDVRITSV